MANSGGYVYILASGRNGTLYIGFTNNLPERMLQHKTGKGSKFAKQNKADKLVYYEYYDYAQQAILRETQMKKWERKWKLYKIEETNPMWEDLSLSLNN
ncbi:MAG TPA: GIY-YIG nuclease family protein [Alphaproteobacteria bacterium]|nr:GIY-YIG nuclease family protein [Alphaproteobacteria bacterium]